jgi:hypothetical protein
LSFTIETPDGNTLDLGGTFDVLNAFQEIARTAPIDVGAINRLPHDDTIHSESQAKQIADEAQYMLDGFSHKLSPGTRWVLDILAQL